MPSLLLLTDGCTQHERLNELNYKTRVNKLRCIFIVRRMIVLEIMLLVNTSINRILPLCSLLDVRQLFSLHKGK